MVKLFSKNSNLCDHNSPTSQTDGRTDRQTTCNRNTALCTTVHRAVIKRNKISQHKNRDFSKIAWEICFVLGYFNRVCCTGCSLRLFRWTLECCYEFFRVSRASSANVSFSCCSSVSPSSTAAATAAAAAAGRISFSTTCTNQLHWVSAGHARANVCQWTLSGLRQSGRTLLSTVHLRVTNPGY